MSDVAKCKLCGEPMPPGEEVFYYHGYSGPCPKPPLPKPDPYKPVAEKIVMGLLDISEDEINEQDVAIVADILRSSFPK